MDELQRAIAKAGQHELERRAAREAELEAQRRLLKRARRGLGIFSGVLAVATLAAYFKVGITPAMSYVALVSGALFGLAYGVYRFFVSRVDRRV